MTMTHSTPTLLNRAVRANSLFCAGSGAGLLLAARPLSGWLGLPWPALLGGLGAMLVVYGALLWRVSAESPLPAARARIIIALDIAWVVGSAALLLADQPGFTTAGKWAVAVVADIVALFALVQFIALRRRA